MLGGAWSPVAEHWSRAIDGSVAARGHERRTVQRRGGVAVMECGAEAWCAGGGGAGARRAARSYAAARQEVA
jgi:hypothetical protein